MDKQKYRNIISHHVERGKTPKEIHDELVQTYGEASPSYSTVKYWSRGYKCGVEGAGDAHREGRPNSAIMQTTIDQIARMIENERKISIQTLASRTNTSYGTAFKIIHEHLRMKKFYTKWVPYNQSAKQKEDRVQLARKFLMQFGTDFEQTKARLITSDETRVMYETPCTNESSREWHSEDSPRPQRPKLSPRGDKVMLTVWWDAKGIILLDYWRKSDKISYNQYDYQGLIRKVRNLLPRVRRGMMKAGPLVLIDNASIHTAGDTDECIRECGFEKINFPSHSPDIAPSDYYLFRNLKTWLRGQKFDNEEHLQRELEAWFESKPVSYYDRGIDQLRERMQRVINSGGDYIE